MYKVIYRDGGFLSDVLAGLDQVRTQSSLTHCFPIVTFDLARLIRSAALFSASNL